jgi:hypothetical protein
LRRFAWAKRDEFSRAELDSVLLDVSRRIARHNASSLYLWVSPSPLFSCSRSVLLLRSRGQNKNSLVGWPKNFEKKRVAFSPTWALCPCSSSSSPTTALRLRAAQQRSTTELDEPEQEKVNSTDITHSLTHRATAMRTRTAPSPQSRAAKGSTPP